MQILKDEIRENILITATKLFYQQGFGKTTTRQIADKVQMSVSNLYKYFKNKEALFEAIVDAYYMNYRANFVKFISHQGQDGFDAQSNAVLANALYKSIKTDHVKFVLLMDKSDGTKYVGFKDEIIALLKNHILQGITTINKEEYIINIIARNFFYGIVEIAKNYQNNAWAQRNINLLVQYHMNGIALLYK